jgi:hypothetical protein
VRRIYCSNLIKKRRNGFLKTVCAIYAIYLS